MPSHPARTLNEKLLYSSFLLLVGLAYMMALAYLYTSFEGIDSKPGLSVEDVADYYYYYYYYYYYGNRSSTRLEAALRGPMAGYIETEQRHHVVEWLKSGALKEGYDKTVRSITELTQ